jgi:hypothetical protein
MVADKRTLADTQLLSIRNQLLIGDFPFKTSIDRGFRYAMFDCRMVAEMEALYHIGPCAGITRHSARRLCILACSSWILNTATLWSSNMRMKTIQNHHVWGCLRARSFAYWHAQTAQRDCPLSTKTTVSESILYDHAKRLFLNGTLALALPTMISNHWGWWSFKFPPKKSSQFLGQRVQIWKPMELKSTWHCQDEVHTCCFKLGSLHFKSVEWMCKRGLKKSNLKTRNCFTDSQNWFSRKVCRNPLYLVVKPWFPVNLPSNQ